MLVAKLKGSVLFIVFKCIVPVTEFSGIVLVEFKGIEL